MHHVTAITIVAVTMLPTHVSILAGTRLCSAMSLQYAAIQTHCNTFLERRNAIVLSRQLFLRVLTFRLSITHGNRMYRDKIAQIYKNNGFKVANT